MICQSCGKEYFEDYRIDKKQRELPSKYCSRICANKRIFSENTKRQIGDKLRKVPNKFCTMCGNKISNHNISGVCFLCKSPKKTRAELMNNHRLKKKKELVQYKGGKCQKCGYNKCITALEFHHRNPEEKDFSISWAIGNMSFSELLLEVEKCDLVCSNCHKEIHYEWIHGEHGRVVDCT
jgi:hypothetical protein